jgi:uncharacterized protein with PhoU and TrkA domain
VLSWRRLNRADGQRAIALPRSRSWNYTPAHECIRMNPIVPPLLLWTTTSSEANEVQPIFELGAAREHRSTSAAQPAVRGPERNDA